MENRSFLDKNIRLYRVLLAAGFAVTLLLVLLTPLKIWLLEFFADKQEIYEGYTPFVYLAFLFTGCVFLPGLGAAAFAVPVTWIVSLFQKKGNAE